VSQDVIDRHLTSHHVLCKASNLLQTKLSQFLQPPTVRYKDNWARKSFCRLNSQVMDPAAYAIHLLLELTWVIFTSSSLSKSKRHQASPKPPRATSPARAEAGNFPATTQESTPTSSSLQPPHHPSRTTKNSHQHPNTHAHIHTTQPCLPKDPPAPASAAPPSPTPATCATPSTSSPARRTGASSLLSRSSL